MALEAGAVYTRIGADIKGLEAGVRQAEATIKRYAETAQRTLDSAFTASGAPAAARKAAQDAVDAARKGMESRIGAAREAFTSGLIDEREFGRRARAAGTTAATELKTAFGQLTRDGVLPPEVGQKLEAELTASARKAGEDAGRAADRAFAQTFGTSLTALGTRLSIGLTLPIIAAGVAAYRSASEFERLEIGLGAVTGSSAEAAIQLERLKEVAKEPGLGFREAVRGSTNLQAVGFSAERSERALIGFGRAVAMTGGGAAELDRIFMQLSQSAAVGRILSADWRPIIQTAPAVASAMQEVFGTIDPQQIEAMGLGFDEFFDQLVAHLETLPPAAGGAAKAAEDFSDAMFRAKTAIGGELIPVIAPLVSDVASLAEGFERVDPATRRTGVAIGIAAAATGPLAVGIGTATAAVNAFNISLASTAIRAGLASGGLTLILGGLAAAFVKARLDAAAAGAAFEEAMQKAQVAGSEFDRSSMQGLRAALQNARNSLQDVEHDAGLVQAKIDRLLEGGLQPGEGKLYVDLQQDLKALGAQADIARTRVETLQERYEELRDAPVGDLGAIIRPLPPLLAETTTEAERLADALRDFPAPRELVVDASQDAVAMGLAQAALTEFERAQAMLNERAARGLIDQEAMATGARFAAQRYNRALLEVLDQWELTPQIRAQIQARLRVEFEDPEIPPITPPVDSAEWQDFGNAASVAASGVVNVADAFGDLSDSTRRALTGVSELARGIGQIQGGPLMTAANVPGMVGIAGGAAQLIASAIGANEEAQRVTRENTRAIERLRQQYEDTTRGDLQRGIDVIGQIRQIQNPIERMTALGRSMDTLRPLLNEFGISLEKNAFQGLVQLEEALRIASGRAFEFGSTLDGFRARASALDEIFDRSGAQAELDRAYAALSEFAPELLRQLGGMDLDLASGAGRDELERVLREAITAYAEGTLDTSLLDRFESGDAFVELLLSLDRPLDRLREQLDAVTSAASNVPPIFDIELRRRMAMGAGSGAAAPEEAMRGLVDSIPRATDAVDGFVDQMEAAWSRLSALTQPDTRAPAPVGGGFESRRGVVVNIHNPPAGMDTRETARQVKRALIDDLGRGGASELRVALGVG